MASDSPTPQPSKHSDGRSGLPFLAACKILAVLALLATAALIARAVKRRADTPHYQPRLPIVGEVINELGSWGVPIAPTPSVEGYEAAAIRRAGGQLTDFGYDFDNLRPLLSDFVDDLNSQHVSELGRVLYDEFMSRLLASRLQSMALLSNPATAAKIEAQRIDRPVVVLGLPRSGTTAFHRILSAVPAFRGVKYFEVMYPSGLPGDAVHGGIYSSSSGVTDPRLEVVTRELATRDMLGTEVLERLHKVMPDGAEEDNHLLDQSTLFLPAYITYAPKTFMGDKDYPSSSYPMMHRLMKMIQWLRPLEAPHSRWLFKAPCHVAHLQEVHATYPNADYVWIFRDPVRVLASMCSLTAAVYRLTTIPFAEQAQRIGETSYQMVVGWARRAVREFEALPADVQDRVVFVRYDEFVANPVDEACRVANALGEACREDGNSAEASVWQALADHAREHPRNKFGRHQYSLEDYGFTEEQIQQDTAFYTEWWEAQRTKRMSS